MTHDPFDSATQAGDRPNLIYGEVDITASFVILQKGIGKLAYDEKLHDPKDRRTSVQITVIPLPESGLSFPTQRDILAESAEWSRIVWPSCRSLGLHNARDLKGRWAAVELVETGRTYTNKQKEERKATTIKFHAVYADEADCREAFETARGGGSEPAQPANNGAAGADPNRELVKQFLPPLVKQAGGDRDKLAGLIAGIPQVSKYFSVDSPEVRDLLGEDIPF